MRRQVAYVKRLLKLVTHIALDGNYISSRNFIFVFLKRNTPDIKHHVGEDHSNSFSHIITHNNLDSNSTFRYPQVSSLRFEHLATKLRT